ncbi:hypothetical protein BU24DRAFT_458991 [Aaosphaeria arxii CBS 175.79]|uniref:4'-phosphopantetheinyl transferase domain-containing protein n=1 Tax=Aaosphaeria arxii CBS 175.79 TaxID=1450172 RepID=A0A6A5Y324_9PLEO|nr:uncharacterized protein BU24DRAFT_458991 [Aaosphaeria arxii CBS 175.79]KAF2019301.1 hypothetical protein BU24DRAFT_458991 [Aaosphaeria arxii CBS 175.79]
MPPRPFPYPLKIGTDICSIQRIQSILTANVRRECEGSKSREPLKRFLSKIFTYPECQFFYDRFGPVEAAYNNIGQVSQYLAGRWAAKEACRKACGHLGKSNGLHSIMILPSNSSSQQKGGPQGLILRHRLPSRPPHPSDATSSSTELERTVFNIEDVEGQFCEVSITHDGQYAQAVALVPSVPKEWWQASSNAAADVESKLNTGNTSMDPSGVE